MEKSALTNTRTQSMREKVEKSGIKNFRIQRFFSKRLIPGAEKMEKNRKKDKLAEKPR